MPPGIDVRTPPDVGAEPGDLKGVVASLFGGGPPKGPGGGGPDPYTDMAGLKKQFEEFSKECFDQRWVYERSWWRNLLYLLGRQWIYYDTDRGQWRDKRMAKWVPRPVTNKIDETQQAITSVFNSVVLSNTVRPDGNDPKDVTTAETADKLEAPIAYEHQIARVFRDGDFWLVATGNCFYQLWWDKRGARGAIQIPFEQCVACGEVYPPDEVQAAGGVCPKCGSPMQRAAGPDGQPIGESVSSGRGATDAISPFEIAFPLSVQIWDDLPGLIRKRWRTKAWAESNLPKSELAKIQWETMSNDRSLQLLRGLATQNDTSSQPLSTQGVGSEAGQEGYTEYEQWLKPSMAYPEGLVMRVAGEGSSGVILQLPDQGMPGPIPFRTAKDEPIFPFLHVGYAMYGGRIWARSPLDSLIQKQDQLNQIDSLMQMIIQRVANPVWLEPKGTEVKKFTGEPGLVVKYNPLALGGATAKPEKIEGSNVPAGLFQIREQILSDIENLAGTYDIIKGQKPTGVEAFSALQLLVERSQSRYGTVLASRGEAYRRWYSIAIELERQYGPMARTWAVLGANNRWTFEQFKGADLQGAIHILVEDGSQTPKTSLGKRAAIEQLSQLGVIIPANPDTAYAILQAFGQTDLWPGLDYDVKSALQEQDEWERWAQTADMAMEEAPMTDPMTGQPAVDPMTGQPAMTMQPGYSSPPPGMRKPWHNDAVHMAEHKKWANSDTVRQILLEKPWIEPTLGWMLQQHEMAIAEAQMQQATLAAGPANPNGKDGGGVGGGRAMRNSNQESGGTQDVPKGTNERPAGQGPA